MRCTGSCFLQARQVGRQAAGQAGSSGAGPVKEAHCIVGRVPLVGRKVGNLPCLTPPGAARLPPLPPGRGVLRPTPLQPGTGALAAFAGALAGPTPRCPQATISVSELAVVRCQTLRPSGIYASSH